MLTKALLDTFWKEFRVPFQDEDSDFPYANPSDAARSLIQARNWTGTITEDLISVTERKALAENSLAELDTRIQRLERNMIALAVTDEIPAWATKNKEAQRAYAWSRANAEQLLYLQESEDRQIELKAAIRELAYQEETLNKMLKALEKTTDWLVQYINWQKFELRDINEPTRRH